MTATNVIEQTDTQIFKFVAVNDINDGNSEYRPAGNAENRSILLADSAREGPQITSTVYSI